MATPDRWPPWIEPMKRLAAAAVINTTAATVLADLSITATPHVNARLLVTVDVLAQETAFAAGSYLNVRLMVNGAENTPVRRIAIGGNGLNSINVASLSWTVELTKETTYAITVEALLGAAGSAYLLLTSTGISVVGMPRVHLP